MTKLADTIVSANTGLDAIKRAPIVNRDTGIRCLRITDVSQLNDFKDWGFCEVAENNFERFQLQPGEIIIARTGNSIGVNMIIDKHVNAVFNNGLIRLRINTKNYSAKFVYYTLRTREYSEHIDSIAFGTSTQPNMKIKDFLRFEFPDRTLSEQESIAYILSALDDKIELNRRMNATLEAMARALFQSWFVDFDPVRAKLDGRPPTGLDPETAALFPGAFQDSIYGHIPQGWVAGRVGDMATFKRSAINPGDHPDEIFDHYSLPAFDNSRTPKTELGSAIMSNKYLVEPDSVLLSKLNPHIPRIWLPDLRDTHRPVCSTEFMVACAKQGVSREYLFSLFTSSAFDSVYGTLVTGTTGSHQRIRPDSVFEMNIVVPSPKVIQAFSDFVKPLFGRISCNMKESNTLAALRDTLLPKLLSGELNVSASADALEVCT